MKWKIVKSIMEIKMKYLKLKMIKNYQGVLRISLDIKII